MGCTARTSQRCDPTSTSCEPPLPARSEACSSASTLLSSPAQSAPWSTSTPHPRAGRLYSCHRPGRHRYRSPHSRRHRPEARLTRNSPHHCSPLHRLRRRLRPRLGLALVSPLPLHRRTRHRRVFRAWPRLHRRTCSGQMARPPGCCVSAQRRLRHRPRLHFELPHPPHEPRRNRVALADRHCRPSRRLLPRTPLRHPPQPALVSIARPHR